MQKLTAIKARTLIHDLSGIRTICEELFRQALEIALPVLEQQESQCQKCGGTGMADSGGTQPWGEQILVECDCQFEQQEKGDDAWIEWGGGDCPVGEYQAVEVRFRDGDIALMDYWADLLTWKDRGYQSDIIAYRVIENDGREG